MHTVMYVTVGRSLEGVHRLAQAHSGVRGPLPGGNLAPSTEEDPSSALFDSYRRAFPDLPARVGRGDALDTIAFPAAEIESLCYWLVKQQDRRLRKIVLLPTTTNADDLFANESYACAVAVEKIIRDLQQTLEQYPGERGNMLSELTDVAIEPFRFDPGDASGFPHQVAAFMALLGRLIDEHSGERFERQVLNITGGYKGLIPFFSLLGFLRDETETIYKSEGTSSFILIPPLPLTWDFKSFDEYRALLRGGATVGTIPPKFRLLFKEDDSPNGFGMAIQRLYERDRLRRFGRGTRLMRYLDREQREELERRIPQWEYIWIGDGIPETVEHSRGHNARLLAYAADLLEPRLSLGGFLTQDELYLLICCLWLHDIGHTALSFEYQGHVLPIGRFPSLVRRFHNLTSAQLILDPSRGYLPLQDGRVVALVSKYNRKNLPLASSSGEWADDIFEGIRLKPLDAVVAEENRLDRISKARLSPDRASLLCALLRLLDGCDVQSDRLIEPSYVKERRNRLQYEIEHLWQRFEDLLPVLVLCSAKQRTFVEDISVELRGCYGRWLRLNYIEEPYERWPHAKAVERDVKLVWSGTRHDTPSRPGLLPFIRDVLTGAEELREAARPVMVECLSILDRIAFKMVQEVHVAKHAAVKLHFLSEESGTYHFNFLFDDRTPDELAQDVKSDVGEELSDEVADVLAKAGIRFHTA